MHERNTYINAMENFFVFAPFSVAILDPDMNYIVYSRQWQTYFALDSYGDLTGRNHYDLFPQISKLPNWMKAHEDVLKRGQTIRSDSNGEVFQTASGAKQFRWWICPTYTRDYTQINGMMMCVDDVKNAEQKHQQVGKQQSWIPSTGKLPSTLL